MTLIDDTEEPAPLQPKGASLPDYLRILSRLCCESAKVGKFFRSSIGSAASAMRGHPRRLRLRVTMIWSVAEYQYAGPSSVSGESERLTASMPNSAARRFTTCS